MIKEVNNDDCCWYCKFLNEYSFANDCTRTLGKREPFSETESMTGVCEHYENCL